VGLWERFLRWVGISLTSLILFSLVLTLAYRFVPVSLTPLMAYRAGQSLANGQLPIVSKSWVSLNEISSRVPHAVIAAEDMKFYEHNGFDWEAIEKARESNRRLGHTKRGASTISQQVAKNVFLLPHRTWLRKGLEAYFTTLIELMWPKARIMEVYLNVIELGDGVYGVEAASQKFFAKTAQKINPQEAALIAAVLPNPRQLKIARPSSYVRLRQGKIRRRMPAAAATLIVVSPKSHSKSRSSAVRKSGMSHASSIPSEN
jgi:monofunctional biosynthetic peptidoglycan transglycosylase